VSSDLTEEHFVFLPIEYAVTPHPKTHYVSVFRNRWWAVHPDKGLLLFHPRRTPNRLHQAWIISPQCNSDEAITRKLTPAWAEVRFYPLIYVPIIVRDYDYSLPLGETIDVEVVEA
jgi:hypothetical protein